MLKRPLSAAVLIAALPMYAQSGPGPMGGPPAEHGPGMFVGPLRSPVTNAPYTATVTDTSTEKLQDGTVLTHTDSRVVARDSLGRTREEISVPAHGDRPAHSSVVIFDPVTRTVTQMRPDTKTAVVRTLRMPDTASRPEGPPLAAVAGTSSRGPRERKDVVESDLGSKTIGTVVATGKRFTRTIPAGTMDNVTALVSTREEWTSPDLKIQLSRTETDPFHGTHTMTTSGLTRAEPDAALFKVPADFAVTQVQEHAGRRGFGQRDEQAPPPPPDGAAPPSPGI